MRSGSLKYNDLKGNYYPDIIILR